MLLQIPKKDSSPLSPAKCVEESNNFQLCNLHQRNPFNLLSSSNRCLRKTQSRPSLDISAHLKIMSSNKKNYVNLAYWACPTRKRTSSMLLVPNQMNNQLLGTNGASEDFQLKVEI
jgi:hypothetical protein